MRGNIVLITAVAVIVLTVICQSVGQGIAAPGSQGQRYAVLIGVNDYSPPFPDLKYCHNDMAALRDSLVKGGFQIANIFSLYEKADKSEYFPSKSNIVKQLELRLSLANEEDLVLVAFSGHGLLEQNVSYLCPCDADPEKVADTCISLDQLFERMKTCRARNKILVVDACRKELPLAGIRGGANVRGFSDEMLAPPPDVQFLASCETRQWSAEDDQLKRGVFSYYVTQGLEGKADQEEQGNHDGAITLDELYAYAHQKTKLHVANSLGILQRPWIRREGGGVVEIARVVKHDGPPLAIAPFDAKKAKKHQRRWAEFLKVPPETTNTIGMKLVLIPPGEFLMGSPENEEGRDALERQHRVRITKSFYLGQYEVTQGQYEAVMAADPWRIQGPFGSDYPATGMSWEDAVAFCQRLSQRESRNYRLPTEAEWEYACHGGTTTAYSFGDNASDLGGYANASIHTALTEHQVLEYFAFGGKISSDVVGQKKPNSFSLYDMHGNVSEWCADRYAPNFYEVSPEEDPLGPTADSYGRPRVVRGGSFSTLRCDAGRRTAAKYGSLEAAICWASASPHYRPANDEVERVK